MSHSDPALYPHQLFQQQSGMHIHYTPIEFYANTPKPQVQVNWWIDSIDNS